MPDRTVEAPAALPALPSAADLAADTAEEATGLDRELAEIGLLLGQARAEAERQETRRFEAEEQVRKAALGTRAPTTGGPDDAQAALVAATRRAVTMQAQVEILEGKQRALTRYRDRVGQLAVQLTELAAAQPEPLPPSDEEASLAAMSGPDAQESLRREIARQMHDGPAQSLTNITLQAQIVQRLVGRDDERAQAELTQLMGMVQQTLDATKTFIFDVRPMVLDDLGLVPTLRRAIRERAQRGKVAVDLEVSGTDRRLTAELESGLFRIVDEAVVGFLTTQPAGIQVRVDQGAEGFNIMVRTVPSGPLPPVTTAAPPTEAAPSAQGVPSALADMIRDQRASEADRRQASAAAAVQARALPEATWRTIQARAKAAGVRVTLTESGRRLEASTVPAI